LQLPRLQTDRNWTLALSHYFIVNELNSKSSPALPIFHQPSLASTRSAIPSRTELVNRLFRYPCAANGTVGGFSGPAKERRKEYS
jgi:hypothetical protein